MKRTLLIITAMLTIGVAQSSAQNVLDLLKGLGSSNKTEQADSTKNTSSTS